MLFVHHYEGVGGLEVLVQGYSHPGLIHKKLGKGEGNLLGGLLLTKIRLFDLGFGLPIDRDHLTIVNDFRVELSRYIQIIILKDTLLQIAL